MTDNLYDILGVASTATHAEIRKAYRKLAVKYHPDRNPDAAAQEQFRKVTQAYEVLNDPTRRGLYDKYGDIALNPNFKGFEQEPSSQFGDFSSFFSGFGSGHGTQPYQGSDGYEAHTGQHNRDRHDTRQSWQKDEPYETFSFGTGASSNQSRARTRRASEARNQQGAGYTPPKKGDNISVELKVSMLDALRGCSKQVKIARQSRWKRGSNAGVHQELVTIVIPPNTESDTEIYLRGKGNYGEGGGSAGDLVATILVQPHPYLYRMGSDLYLTVPLTLKEALDGAKVEVPTLTGSLRIQIPAGAQLGQKLRLKNRGLNKANGGQGDLYLVLRPELPPIGSPALAELADKLEALYPPQGVRGNFTLDD